MDDDIDEYGYIENYKKCTYKSLFTNSKPYVSFLHQQKIKLNKLTHISRFGDLFYGIKIPLSEFNKIKKIDIVLGDDKIMSFTKKQYLKKVIL